jgi:hypothetical protein
VPDAYVVLGNGILNASASGHGFRRFVMINSDLFVVGGAAREPDALCFVIAHEVGHIAAGHTSYWRVLGTLASQWVPVIGSTLSRAQEYTADNYGHILAPQGARSAMATLAGGKYLNRSVDVDAMADRAVTEPGLFVWIANALSTHPVLVWRTHALRDRRRPGRLLWRPRAVWLWRQPEAPGAYSLPPMVGFTPSNTGLLDRREVELLGATQPDREAHRWTPSSPGTTDAQALLVSLTSARSGRGDVVPARVRDDRRALASSTAERTATPTPSTASTAPMRLGAP